MFGNSKTKTIGTVALVSQVAAFQMRHIPETEEIITKSKKRISTVRHSDTRHHTRPSNLRRTVCSPGKRKGRSLILDEQHKKYVEQNRESECALCPSMEQEEQQPAENNQPMKIHEASTASGTENYGENNNFNEEKKLAISSLIPNEKKTRQRTKTREENDKKTAKKKYLHIWLHMYFSLLFLVALVMISDICQVTGESILRPFDWWYVSGVTAVGSSFIIYSMIVFFECIEEEDELTCCCGTARIRIYKLFFAWILFYATANVILFYNSLLL